MVVVATLVSVASLSPADANPAEGPGGPILVITSPQTSARFGTFFAEILRAEGFNEFAVSDISAVSASSLDSYDVAILARMSLTTAQVAMLTDWVTAGGNLIAMAPGSESSALFGISTAGSSLSNAYLKVDNLTRVGNGIYGGTMQFHGSAITYNLTGATRLAALHSTASNSSETSFPAVTIRNAGLVGGQAAAFAYDLASSIVYTRQGNPAWAGDERDGISPIRANDMFYGNKAGDSQPDWIDLSKVHVPQADEQQRFLANLITEMTLDRKPLPRFWYLPKAHRAAVMVTGDEHGGAGWTSRFDQLQSLSPAGCSVANWECHRGTTYTYPSTPVSNAQAAQYAASGFEVALHTSTGCSDFTPSSINDTFATQLGEFATAFPNVPAPATNRNHCIVWSDWASSAKVGFNYGIRLDTNYYYWPPGWVNNTPGHFTGSAMPMRFADTDGALIDVYQVVTQMTDESQQSYPYTIDTLLDRALGPEQHFGVFTVNAHTDPGGHEAGVGDAVIASAIARNVPIVSSRQMLEWLDARNSSRFSSLVWNSGNNTLSFTIVPGSGSNGLTGQVPARTTTGALTNLTRNGQAVTYEWASLKGMDYAVFSGLSGNYVATYSADSTAPTIAANFPASGATDVLGSTVVTATFSESMDPATIGTATFELRSGTTLVSASVSYDALAKIARLQPASTLAPGTYTATVQGGTTDPRAKDLLGNALAADFTWSFNVGNAPPDGCPCSAWPNTTVPAVPSTSDTGAVELGVRFRANASGYVTGIRFYKGAANTGTHVGNLWTSTGTLLATATFTNETATGWQTVTFSSPVAITANTVYVASYFAPNGGYAADANYFASAGVTNGPLYLLKDGEAGGNGLYRYGSSSAFPNATYQSSNYWVDVIFTTIPGPPDTTPPTITATSPTSGATNVPVNSTISGTFSETLDATTVGSATFELRDASNALVVATVAYSAGTSTATLVPSAPLASSAVYTATLRGGSADPRIKDTAGNALAANLTWSFTTAAASGGGCPCSAWDSTAVPSLLTDPDTAPIELGVKFRTDVSGYITGIRFYKGPQNLGVHTGSLWTSTGTLLATATFAGETASGWQQVNFSVPVAIAANTVYVASYFAPQGRYSSSSQYFASSGLDNGVLHLLQNGVSGGNGVYAYAATSSFPNSTYQSTNYWVDVVFQTSIGPDTTPPTVTATTPLSAATGVSVSTAVTATFNEPLDAATVSGTTFELRNAANSLVAATISYSASTNTATLVPNAALSTSTTYTATLKGGATDPRIKDVAGNALAANHSWSFTTGTTAGCSGNPIVVENCLTGSVSSEWDVSGAGDPSIQGFATDISVNRGGPINFKVSTNASSYRFDIYRLGYYGGLGARKVATVQPSASLPQSQPNCLSDAATGLIDCGNWAVSGSWAVPANATSGIYIAKLVRTDTGGASHIVFIVRDDASTSDVLFQTSDTTWQAYNSYGGNSLYTGAPAGRAYKVSYNRPFNTRSVDNGQDWLFNAEYPMVRWLEANGYNVSYTTGMDSDRLGSLIRNHRVFMSVGHDEYWSGGQRTNVEAARDAGVHLAFFSGNEVFWKTRWENSISSPSTAYRTLVSYKETHAGAKIDPTAIWTGTWRDPRFSPPADGGRPENALTGTIFTVNDGPGGTTSIVVPEADGKMRLWRNTSIATLATGTSATLPFGTLGYEWDEDLDNGSRPAGLIRLSATTVNGVSYLQDYGSTYASGNATHSLTLYKAPSGARVFGAGTVQWSWGLDANHDRAGTSTDVRMQQATVNLLADMATQPATLQAGLVTATASTDSSAPTSAITSPAAGASLEQGTPVTISGTATDAGGGRVGGVEVSMDGGTTWRRATGRGNWTYNWTPASAGSVVIRSRAADDSGNLETAGAGRTVTVTSDVTCPCTIWSSSAVPNEIQDPDTSSTELGVKFRSDVNGFIRGIRFYKGPNNGGTHVGSLWTSSGALLARATFTSETASGWQQVDFATPVAITANTVYVASYFAPQGRYSGDDGYFANQGVDRGVLHALRNGVSGGNGVYGYGASPNFPTSTYLSENYWVDVVFVTELVPGNNPPVITNPGAQTGTVGVAITAVQLQATDADNDPRSFTATGLPPGLLISTSGLITGTPTTAGTFSVTATVSDGRGGTASTIFAWAIAGPNVAPTITNPGAQTSTVGTAVSLQIQANDANNDPLTFSATGLPLGLSISSSGLISGTPTTAGTASVVVTADDLKPGGTASTTFTWTVSVLVDTQAPTRPSTLTSTKVNGNPVLTWTASTDNVGVTGYEIHRSTDGTYNPAVLTTVGPVTTWTDTAVTEAVRYTYAVVAFDAAGNRSTRSPLRSVTAGAVPSTPTTLRASLINGNTQVQLTWNASTDNVGVVEYIIYRTTSGNVLGPEVGRTPTPGWVDTTVTTGAGIRYTYAVKARDAANYLSNRSNFSSVTVP